MPSKHGLILSPTEHAIRKHFKGHPQKHLYVHLCRQLTLATDVWDQQGIAPEIQAWALTTVVAQLLSAQKMCATTDATLIDTLARDILDTVQGRTIGGVSGWLTPH